MESQSVRKPAVQFPVGSVAANTVAYGTYRFNLRNQEEHESLEAYMETLRLMAKKCNFWAMEDRLIMDRFLAGIISDDIRIRLFQEADLTLDKCLQICKKYCAAGYEKNWTNNATRRKQRKSQSQATRRTHRQNQLHGSKYVEASDPATNTLETPEMNSDHPAHSNNMTSDHHTAGQQRSHLSSHSRLPVKEEPTSDTRDSNSLSITFEMNGNIAKSLGDDGSSLQSFSKSIQSKRFMKEQIVQGIASDVKCEEMGEEECEKGVDLLLYTKKEDRLFFKLNVSSHTHDNFLKEGEESNGQSDHRPLFEENRRLAKHSHKGKKKLSRKGALTRHSSRIVRKDFAKKDLLLIKKAESGKMSRQDTVDVTGKEEGEETDCLNSATLNGFSSAIVQTSASFSQVKKSRCGDKAKPHVCSECNAAHATASLLARHMRKHNGQKPYICHDCDSAFTRPCHLKAHALKHRGLECKRYHCKECSASFVNSSNLIVHMRMHTGEKPYMCSNCGATFRRSDNLKSHLRVHSGERPFSCKDCSARFGYISDLKRHIMRKHTNVKPWMCHECGISFSYAAGLTTHMLKHSGGVKPYQCPHCPTSFTNSSNYNRHMVHKHNKKPNSRGPPGPHLDSATSNPTANTSSCDASTDLESSISACVRMSSCDAAAESNVTTSSLSDVAAPKLASPADLTTWFQYSSI